MCFFNNLFVVSLSLTLLFTSEIKLIQLLITKSAMKFKLMNWTLRAHLIEHAIQYEEG